MTKAQRLVNQINERFGLDASSFTDGEIDSLVESLEQLKALDRDDIDSPESMFDEEDFTDAEDEEYA